MAGIVKLVVNSTVIVTDFQTGIDYHCTIRNRVPFRQVKQGCIVCCGRDEYTRKGEVLGIYGTDSLAEICKHFKLNMGNVSKKTDTVNAIMAAPTRRTQEVQIAHQHQADDDPSEDDKDDKDENDEEADDKDEAENEDEDDEAPIGCPDYLVQMVKFGANPNRQIASPNKRGWNSYEAAKQAVAIETPTVTKRSVKEEKESQRLRSINRAQKDRGDGGDKITIEDVADI
jgi:hypothetical protein